MNSISSAGKRLLARSKGRERRLGHNEASGTPIILYLHIPKAGGTTLGECIYDQCHTDEYYVAEEGYLHAGIYYYPIGFFRESHVSTPENVQHALRRKDLRAVVGHFSFGIHRYVSRPWAYVTLLRNPVDRILSLYHFERLSEAKRGHLQSLNRLQAMSIEEFVETPPYHEVNNDQTRRLSGLEPEIGLCTRCSLQQAKHNLRQCFSVVGVTERFDETLILLKRTFGWTKEPLYYPRNVNIHRPPTASLPKATLNAIMERNALDLELYEFAKRMLDEQLSSQDPSLREEVHNFKCLKQSWHDTLRVH